MLETGTAPPSAPYRPPRPLSAAAAESRLRRVWAMLDRTSLGRAASQHRHLLRGALIGAVLGLVISLLIPRRYQAEASIVPEARGFTPGAMGALTGGLAGQLGLTLGGEGTNSPRFYVELLKSRAVLLQVLHLSVRDEAGSRPRPLLEALDLERVVRGDSADAGLRRLRKMVAARVQAEPRIVYVTVTGPRPTLVAEIANGLVDALRRFDVEMRQTEAKERRTFLERRTSEARDALGQAERAMQSFLDKNRVIDAPHLRYEQGRLQRQIELQNQLFMTLATQLETARIDEVNERARFTVIDTAAVPVRPQPRGIPVFLLGGLLAGVGVAAALRAVGGPHATADVVREG